MSIFHESGYLRHNQARLDHLGSLGLALEGKTVLELGAGIGDHTPFFLERGCKVTVTDGRRRNVEALRERYPQLDVRQWDVELDPLLLYPESFDVIFCYGLLYHLRNPINFLRQTVCLGKMILLETCVSPREASYRRREDPDDLRCGLGGDVQVLSREVIRNELQFLFPHVYLPLTQPNHEEFPLDWTAEPKGECRAVFIGSEEELNNPLLTKDLPSIQLHHVEESSHNHRHPRDPFGLQGVHRESDGVCCG